MASKPIRIIAVIISVIAFFAVIFLMVNKTAKNVVVRNITVPNNSVEQVATQSNAPISWRSENWGTNTTEFNYLSTGHTGKHSLKTTMTSYTNGDAKWYFEPQAVTPGKQYTFTDYYKSDVPSRIVVRFEKKDGSLVYKELKIARPASDWTRYQASFTVPPDAKTMTIFHLLSAVGYLITDDYQISNYIPEGFKRGLISITWDDGTESQYTKAFPIHKKYNLPGTFFLISGSLDKKFYMTTPQATKLQAAGNELGSHTVTHPHLSKLKPNTIDVELSKSKTDLHAKFGTTFDDFVTPYGDYSDQVLSTIKKYYRSHRSVEEGYNAKNNFDIYNIVVQNVFTTTPPSQVEAWVDKAKTDKTWLVLVYHQVENPGDKYSISSEDLDKEFKYIKKTGMPAVTFDQAFKEILPQIN